MARDGPRAEAPSPTLASPLRCLLLGRVQRVAWEEMRHVKQLPISCQPCSMGGVMLSHNCAVSTILARVMEAAWGRGRPSPVNCDATECDR